MYRQTAAGSKPPARPGTSARTILTTGIALASLFLFVHTAIAKLQDTERFQKSLAKAPFLADHAGTLSWLVPVAELAIAVLLILPRTQRLGLRLFAGLMGMFTLYIASMLLWAEKLPCSCGGAIEKLSWNQHLWLNLGFIALAMVALRLGRTKTRT